MDNVITDVVARDICSGCSVCVGSCPGHFLTMSKASNGDLTSSWVDGPCVTDCSLCMKVCPFSEGVLNPRSSNREIYGKKDDKAEVSFHEDVGYYDSTFVGYAEVNRPLSASGGLLTWTLERLMTTGEVDRVAVITCEPCEVVGYRFTFKEARTTEEIRQCAGSVYHQVDISEIMSRIAQEPSLRWAITGVPCLCTAMRQAMQQIPNIKRAVRYLLGLACGMYQNSFYTEFLCQASGVHPTEVSDIRYRLKDNSGAASNFLFQAIARDGRFGEKIEYKGIPYFLGRYAFFRCNACNVCMDVFSENADACYMDAWLPEYQDDFRGTSLVVVRNPSIRRLIDCGRIDNRLNVDAIEIDKVVASQKSHVRRKRYLIAMRNGIKFDRSTGRAFPLEDRLAWFVQRYVQRRSKEIWMTTGRQNGIKAFWRAAWDISLLINIERFINVTIGRVMRLVLKNYKRLVSA